MTLYLNDFYVDKKEAVSNQMLLLSASVDGRILAAKRFLGQRSLRKEDLLSNKYILPFWLYHALIPFFVFISSRVHLFTEEKSVYKRCILNISRKRIYISLYRRPDRLLIGDLKKYKKLEKIFVELPFHREILLKNGFKSSQVVITSTPSLFLPHNNSRVFKEEKIKILFASWNNSEGDPLKERGLIYLNELLEANKNFELAVCLRGNKSEVVKYVEILKKNNLLNRVVFFNPIDYSELEKLYYDTDFVAFVPQKRISKDVPNSIIDGFMFGKPAMVSGMLDYANTVTRLNLGLVFKNKKANIVEIRKEDYERMQNSIYKIRLNHTRQRYIDKVLGSYE